MSDVKNIWEEQNLLEELSYLYKLGNGLPVVHIQREDGIVVSMGLLEEKSDTLAGAARALISRWEQYLEELSRAQAEYLTVTSNTTREEAKKILTRVETIEACHVAINKT